jgi:capsid protein
MQDVFEQIARERRLSDELGLVLDSDARTDRAVAAPAPDNTDAGTDRNSNTSDDQGARTRGPRLRAIGTGDSV